jgi:hypothetical protein
MVDESPLIRHLGLPTVLLLLMLGLWFTPASVLGCANRGWLAVSIAVFGELGSVTAMAFAVRTMRTDRSQAWWWMTTALGLLLPAILLLRLP